jgi:hypothetical protein
VASLAGYGDLSFLHGLQQGGLHLGRRPVYFVCQHQLIENRAGLELQLGPALVVLVDFVAGDVPGDVRWQQVRGELYSPQPGLQHLGQGLDGACLGGAGQALK